ncbi:MAG: phosphate ABC transporter substrate-binding protein PstS [Thermoproteota archaeon]|nr:phosphate ABC transporter substrate-binding protein PstS [Candidatus Brockarchaeota archaeon]
MKRGSTTKKFLRYLLFSFLIFVYVLYLAILPSSTLVINGAGSTFVYPLISKWSSEYRKVNPSMLISYQSIGSGGGIRLFINKTVDFGASDAPLNKQQMEVAKGVIHIPETLGAVVISYNLPNVNLRINLTGEVIADIYLGKITKWSDERIAKLNPGIKMPDEKIVVIHRAEGSGTTYVFTDYLSKVSKEWYSLVGRGTSVQWPIGLGAVGSEGVASLINQVSFSIGYIELSYAMQTNMTYAAIKNQYGNFVVPVPESVEEAASSLAKSLPKGNESWENVSLVDAPGKNAYPIVSFSYLLLYNDLSTLPGMNEKKAKDLVNFLWWCIHSGQNYSLSLGYVPLPPEVVKINEESIKMIKFKGINLIGGS